MTTTRRKQCLGKKVARQGRERERGGLSLVEEKDARSHAYVCTRKRSHARSCVCTVGKTQRHDMTCAHGHHVLFVALFVEVASVVANHSHNTHNTYKMHTNTHARNYTHSTHNNAHSSRRQATVTHLLCSIRVRGSDTFTQNTQQHTKSHRAHNNKE